MPRDYAKSGRRKDKKPGQLPGWVWMLGGLSIGLFVAFLVYLNKIVDPSQQTKIIDEVVKTANEGEIINEKRQKQRTVEENLVEKEDEAEFDFYELLPAEERRVTEIEIERRRTENKEERANVIYYIQVGSFQMLEQAQQFRADLLLQGIEPNIHSVDIKNKTWHRVIIGPLKGLDALNTTKRRLRENKIPFVVMEKEG